MDLKTEFIKLIENHEGIIHKVIGLYIHEEEQKKDLFQEILLQSWKSYKNFKGNSKFSTWLYRVSLNTALNFYKKENKHDKIKEKVHVESVEKPKFDDRADSLYYLIKKLNEIDRMLITLHLEGYKNQEIAKIAGISKNNANVKVHRIKLKLIEDFKKLNNEE